MDGPSDCKSVKNDLTFDFKLVDTKASKMWNKSIEITYLCFVSNFSLLKDGLQGEQQR